MMSSAEDFCVNCKKTWCNGEVSLLTDKIESNDRPVVVLLNSVFTALSWYVLHFTSRTLLSSLLFRSV